MAEAYEISYSSIANPRRTTLVGRTAAEAAAPLRDEIALRGESDAVER
jgi:hypothetical protein